MASDEYDYLVLTFSRIRPDRVLISGLRPGHFLVDEALAPTVESLDWRPYTVVRAGRYDDDFLVYSIYARHSTPESIVSLVPTEARE